MFAARTRPSQRRRRGGDRQDALRVKLGVRQLQLRGVVGGRRRDDEHGREADGARVDHRAGDLHCVHDHVGAGAVQRQRRRQTEHALEQVARKRRHGRHRHRKRRARGDAHGRPEAPQVEPQQLDLVLHGEGPGRARRQRRRLIAARHKGHGKRRARPTGLLERGHGFLRAVLQRQARDGRGDVDTTIDME